MLKRCPWCGSSAITIKEPLWTDYSGITHGYKGNYRYYIQCSNELCEAVAPHGKFDDISKASEIAMRQAIDKWNSRERSDDYAFMAYKPY